MEKGKKLCGDEWLSLMKMKCGYTYMHEERCDGKIVAIFVYTKKDGYIDKILGRYEETPPHDDGIALASITGGVEKGQETIDTALMELKEEAGITAEEKDLVYLGDVKPSKAADTVISLYAIDMTGKEDTMEDPKGDGSEGEKEAYVEWIDVLEMINAKDPLLHTMFLRLTNGSV